MPDDDPSEIDVFGSTYEIDDGVIKIHQQISVSQALHLDRYYDECLGLQEALRSSSDDGIDARREQLTVETLEEQTQRINQLCCRSEEIVDALEAIKDCMD